MLRVFWDEVVALDPSSNARDERHMPLCRRGELAALWRQHGLDDVTETPARHRTSFQVIRRLLEPFLRDKDRLAPTSPRSPKQDDWHCEKDSGNVLMWMVPPRSRCTHGRGP